MDTTKYASDLRNRAAQLRGEATKLDAAADVLDPPRKPERKPTVIATFIPSEGSRKDQIAEAIRKHGPMKRKQLEDITKIPPGTMATYLQEKHGFYKLEGNKWGLEKPQRLQPDGTGQ